MSGSPEAPAWLSALVVALRDGREPATVADWEQRVRDDLDRLDGRVPFRVVYDWQARVVAALPDGADGPYRTVGELYRRALAGEQVGVAEWRDALGPALRELYRAAYPYADGHAVAYANAQTYATANGFGADEVAAFADSYAELSTGANRAAFAAANAIANADALATALAAADGQAYAGTYPVALVNALAWAEANRAGVDDPSAALRAAYGRLADLLAESLARVAV